MYITKEFESGAFWGSSFTQEVDYINEAYKGEAFDLFKENTIQNSYRGTIEVQDDMSGEVFMVDADEFLSAKQIAQLKAIDKQSMLNDMLEQTRGLILKERAKMAYAS